jgi:protein TonB
MQLRLDEMTNRPACHPGMPVRLVAFIVLSVFAHALLLINDHPPETLSVSRHLGSPSIQVHLSDSRQAPAATKAVSSKNGHQPAIKDQRAAQQRTTTRLRVAKPNTMDRQPRIVARDSTPELETALTSATTSSNKEIAATSETKEAQAEPAENRAETNNSDSQRNFLLGQIHDQLSRHLYYPQRARRRGWQGEVLIAFHINREGQLGDIRLARSSGYPLLDNSAMAAMHKVKAIPFLQQTDNPRRLGWQAMDLQLPVLYQLQEG